MPIRPSTGSPQTATNLVDLLRRRAQLHPERIAFTYLKDGESDELHMTWGELDAQARRIASHLQAIGAPGGRALLLYLPGLEFISALFGCLYAGVVAVPAYPPDPRRLDRSLPRLQAIVDDCRPTIALATSSVISMLNIVKWQGRILGPMFNIPLLKRLRNTTVGRMATAGTSSLQSLDWIATDTLEEGRWSEPRISGQSLAYLQYTSGSTSAPKGVMISHENALINVRMGHMANPQTEEMTLFNWLPLYHDMGLISQLYVVFLGSRSILLSPVDFLQKPLRWLKGVTRYSAVATAGPNFAFELCTHKITDAQKADLDLSSLSLVGVGAEPTRYETLRRFADAFAPCGFRWEAFNHSYGLAEAVVAVSVSKDGAPPRPLSIDARRFEERRVSPVVTGSSGSRGLVGCGQPLPLQNLIIVDPDTRTRCRPDEVGEIWLSGPHITGGYWERPEATQETFQAYLADTGAGPWLRTGDLGFVWKGELFIAGRIKDTIIIRGRNHYPQDIEKTVEESHPALRPGCGAACAMEVDGEERLVLFQEIRLRLVKSFDPEEVAGAIRKAVIEHHALDPAAVIFVEHGSIPKTSSGKIQRHACRGGLIDGSLEILARWGAEPSRSQGSAAEARAGGGAASGRASAAPGPAGSAPKPEGPSRVTRGPEGQGSGPSGRQPHAEPPRSAPRAPGEATRREPARRGQAAIQAWLTASLAEKLRVQPSEVDPHRPLAEFGLDSAAAVGLSGDLETWLGIPVPPTMVYDHPTIAALSAHLAGAEGARAPASSGEPAPAGDGPGDEGIAIVGAGCRFPGGVTDLDAFWALLTAGVDAITEVPASRWDRDALFDPTPGTPGKMYTRWGGFIDGVDLFDNAFFGIAPREAASLDPQQRILLEVSWEALESAGLVPSRLAGSATGVFIGISSNDYYRLLARHPAGTSTWAGTGNALSIAANRLSYVLDLRGPSMAVDTACSSSLTAVSLACDSLRQGRCDLALAGGVNLILSPEGTVTFSQARMMAADGRCKTFDAAADGYTRGEGCGVVVLKRASDALRDGDEILAIIRGAAVTQDGRSNGLTAPNGPAQRRTIALALEQAGAQPADIGYVEAHGTGTPLGDPIELNTLKELLGSGRAPDQPCLVGSVKTNIGHLEAAAGVAGLLKAALALKHGQIPAHLNLRQLNPLIDLEGSALSIPTALTPWPGEGRRLAGISSFGFGGTNAHVILEAPPSPAAVPASPRSPQPPTETAEAHTSSPARLLTLSARDDASLQALASRYAEHLAAHPEIDLGDLCYSAHTGRAHLPRRVALVHRGRAELARQLSAFGGGEHPPGLIAPPEGGSAGRVAFLFTGQGAQYAGMGRALFDSQPAFREAIERCDALLEPVLERPLLSILYPPEGDGGAIDETQYTQPALFALEYAAAQLWMSWGIVPDVVFGHSVGEIAAACVAGVFSLADALRLVAERGRLMGALPPGGAMAAILAPEAEIAGALAEGPGGVSIAAINGPRHGVISGSQDAVSQLCAAFEARGIEARPLRVSHAFHSALMDPALEPFEATVETLPRSAPTVPLISCLTGALAGEEITTAAYWRDQLRQPVRFAQGMAAAHALGCDVWLEVGPHPTLLAMGAQVIPAGGAAWLPSMRRGFEADQIALEALGQLYVRGRAIDWQGFHRSRRGRRVPLPTYPFQRSRHWIEADPQGASAGVSPIPTATLPGDGALPPAPGALHPLLGFPFTSSADPGAHLWQARLSAAAPAYLGDHRVAGAVVFPAAGFLEMALASAHSLGGAHAVEGFQIKQALAFDGDRPRTAQLVTSALPQGGAALQIASRLEGPAAEAGRWTVHASARLRPIPGADEQAPALDLAALKARLGAPVEPGAFYKELAAHGLEYGPAFQVVEALWAGPGEALGRIRGPAAGTTSYRCHPAALDGALQLLAAAGAAAGLSEGGATWIPVGFDRVIASDVAAGELYAYATLDLPRQVTTAEGAPSNGVRSNGAADKGANAGDVRSNGAATPSTSSNGTSNSIAREGGGTSGARSRSASASQLRGEVILSDESGAPILTLSGVTLQRLDAPAETPRAAEDVLFDLRWEQRALGEQAARASGGPGAWILLEGGELGARLAVALEARGDRVVRALLGPGGEPSEGGALSVDPASAAGFADLLHTAAQAGPIRGILHLWSLSPAQGTSDHGSPHAAGYLSALRLIQDLSQAGWRDTPRLYLVTRGAQPAGDPPAALPLHATLWGLGRTAMHEHPELRCTLVDVSGDAGAAARQLLEELDADDTEPQVALGPEGRSVARIARWRPETASGTAPAEGRALRLEITDPGVLDRLSLRPLDRRPPQAGEVEIEVEAAGLNFLDVLLAMGVIPDDVAEGVARAPRLGGECAGRVAAVGEGVDGLKVGDRVVAFAPSSFGSFVTTLGALTCPLPAGLSFAEGATLPIAFLTAYYALAHVARLGAGERVLIHAGTGGVGMAAIQWAQHVGAQVFATAGSEAKRALLRSMGVVHVSDSRSAAFVDDVLAATGGEGVDVVLNSLSGELIGAGLGLLRSQGRFIELGKLDYYKDSPLGLRPFLKRLTFSLVDLRGMCIERPQVVKALLAEVMGHFETGALWPLPHRVFPVSRAADAFREMATAAHTGKLVIGLRDPEARLTLPAAAAAPLTTEGATWLITGGLGALGLSAASWLVDRGIRHLALISRRAPGESAREVIGGLQARGAQVEVLAADVAQADQLGEALEEIRAKMPPLRGVLHAAGVLDDALIQNQDPARFDAVMAPKILGALNLHALTSGDPLEHFVMYASAAGVLGSPGQANYAAANAFLDALAHHRRSQGRPALSLDWGPFAVGMAAAQAIRGDRLSQQGMEGLSLAEGHQVLDRALGAPRPQLGAMRLDMGQWRATFPQAAAMPLFEHLRAEAGPGDAAIREKSPLLIKLEAAAPTERRRLLLDHMIGQLAQVLRMDPAQLAPESRLADLGLDSLMGLELRNRLESSLALQLPVTALWNYPTVVALADFLVEQITPDASPEPPPAPADPDPPDAEPALPSLPHEGGLLGRLDDELDALESLL